MIAEAAKDHALEELAEVGDQCNGVKRRGVRTRFLGFQGRGNVALLIRGGNAALGDALVEDVEQIIFFSWRQDSDAVTLDVAKARRRAATHTA